MIEYLPDSKTFHLHNAHLSCIMNLLEDDLGKQEVIMSYFGAPIADPTVCLNLLQTTNGISFDSERQFLPYVCPTSGRGDYRTVMATVREKSGQCCTELFYCSHAITSGKPVLSGLPATYTESDDEAETLHFLLHDDKTGFEAELCYTLYADRPILTCSVCYRNTGAEELTLLSADSFCLSLPGEWNMLHLPGAWARERSIECMPAGHMARTISSTRGASGAEHNPFVALTAEDTTEFSGECIGVNLVYSGNFEMIVSENAYNTTRLLAGLNRDTIEWHLRPNDTLQTPEAVCCYSGSGLNTMSQALHDLYRTRLCRGYWRDRERPVLINSWEATYFDYNHDKIMQIAKTAADVGVELFVLDDGWFGHRDTDNNSLGDWVPDLHKLPNGLKGLAEDINRLGLQFGLWFEPEMVSPDSDLYRSHPDWCLHVEGRRRTEAKNQLILDMSRSEVQEYIIKSVTDVLSSAPISYVKWDMNRNFLEAGSALLNDGRQGELAHRYMLGLYHVLDVITKTFPHLLFESCSGGGGRFDAGMLFYMPQTWTSDDTDAMERLYIQYGTSLCYPCSAMGAHVSAVPNHQVGRITPMRTRGDVALSGNFGYELDLSTQTPEDLNEIRRQIQQVKALRSTTEKGTFTRLLSPWKGNITAWQFVDEKQIIVCAYRMLAKPNPDKPILKLRNLPKGKFRSENGNIYDAMDLMHVGIALNFPKGDFASYVVVLERLNR